MNDALKAATEWYAKLNADDVSETERMAFQHWQQASDTNSQAWQRIESVAGQFDGIAPAISRATLLPASNANVSLQRRLLLKNLGLFVAVSTVGYLGYRHQPWRAMLADYATNTGEHREIELADATRVILNTDSAIDIAYTTQSRTVVLLKGEILIETGHGAGSDLPFIVQTVHGQVRALGTRFIVRNNGDYHTVSVFEGAVAITPSAGNIEQRRLYQDDMATFSTDHVSAVMPLPPGVDLWVKGIINVVNMPLSEFIAELARYHSGILRCDPSIANIAISGAFPVKDFEAVLASLARTYPIRIDSVTRYWVTLKPA